ncbi:MAG: DNA-binding protein YbiB [Pseudomonadota bacterium]
MDQATLTRFIKEIGRGKNAAGDLSREDARSLFTAVLSGLVPDLQLGAILIALRVKGESLEELAGFAAASEASYNHLPALPGSALPVVIPSYNGARQLPNLVALLALLLAREDVPVLIHGVMRDPGRVSTREVLEALSIAPSMSASEARVRLADSRIAFMPTEVMAPQLATTLALRAALGLRNSAHTLVKMLQPFAGPAVRIVSVTHPEYLTRMTQFFTTHDSDALILRGAEGEAVAHPRREPAIVWAHDGVSEVWTDESMDARVTPQLPQNREADTTARWIEAVLEGAIEIPPTIAHQVACCKRAVNILSARRATP